MNATYKLVLIRHGQSTWNLENRFTGWTDVGLTPQGEAEAHMAGKVLREGGYSFDIAYTSVLKRAVKTLWIVLEELEMEWLPVVRAWQLNERHYGDLQGLNKAEMAARCEAPDIMLAMQPVGPLIPLVFDLQKRFPGTTFSVIADHESIFRQLSESSGF